MTALVTERLHHLAETLADLKVRVRAAIASELGRTIGAAVRDVLVVTLTHRLSLPTRSTATDRWHEEAERGQWGQPASPHDPWDEDPDNIDQQPPARSPHESESSPALPAAAAVAVGVHIGRWWLARQGGIIGAVAAGVLVTTLGLATGSVARAALAVIAATADVLTAGSPLPASLHNSD